MVDLRWSPHAIVLDVQLRGSVLNGLELAQDLPELVRDVPITL
jgi:hypothetical protein